MVLDGTTCGVLAIGSPWQIFVVYTITGIISWSLALVIGGLSTHAVLSLTLHVNVLSGLSSIFFFDVLIHGYEVLFVDHHWLRRSDAELQGNVNACHITIHVHDSALGTSLSLLRVSNDNHHLIHEFVFLNAITMTGHKMAGNIF